MRRALFVLLVLSMAGVAGSASPELFSPRALAQATPPFSCFFAGINQNNNIINSGIICSTPNPGGSGGTTLVIPSPPINATLVTTGPQTYQIGITLGYCLGIVSGAAAFTCATAVPQSTPSPAATSTGCGVLSWSGSFPYTLAGNFSTCAGSAYPTLVCTGLATCSPNSGPTPAIFVPSSSPLPCPTASTNITIAGTSMPGCSIAAAAQSTPKPTPTSNGCATLTITGSFPYTFGVNSLGCAEPNTVSVTTASACTAFVSCGTINFPFVPAYGAAPYCSAPGIQDTTTATQLWVGVITAVSGSSVTFAYGPLVTTSVAHSLVFTFACGT